MNLLIDMGNTRLKWLLADDGRFETLNAVDYRQTDCLMALQQAWQAIKTPEIIAIASVSNQQLLNEVKQLCLCLWPLAPIRLPQSTAVAYGIKNAYTQPEKLGIDRWLALIAAHHHHSGNVCIVDCGTAITVDGLQADGVHTGGLICPGLRLMKQALAGNTAALDFSNQPFAVQLETKTEAAIANGVLLAAIGLIEQAMQKLGSDYQLVLTGGDADILARGLNRPSIVDDYLIFKGLSLFCQGDSAA
ncbi:MAG: type III pantothenate kinase [Methylomonas sp.]|nr:MAG: type III pantothenate kinase [Methylomonas sp.]